MADIFLSYAREDEARAAVVARVLGELGWSVFWDRRIIAGTSWDEVVERELQACRCVVVLWSAASIASRWVKTEARFALQRSTLVPANLDRSEPPLEFRFLESAQLHTWLGATDDSEFSVLSEGIAQHVKPAPRESGRGPGSSGGQQDDAVGVAQLTPPPDPKKPDREALAKRRTMQLEASLQEARKLLAQGQLELALDTCQQALTFDESHVGALRLEEEIESALRRQASSQQTTAGSSVSAETLSHALNVEPIATPIAASKGERALTVPAPSFDAAVVVDEAPRIVGFEVQSNVTDYSAGTSAPRRSWPSRLRQHWIPIASAAVVVVAAVVMYSNAHRPTSLQHSDINSAHCDHGTARGDAGRPISFWWGRQRQDRGVDRGSVADARPVPFGAPVRFRPDMWSLPDEPLLGLRRDSGGPVHDGQRRATRSERA